MSTARRLVTEVLCVVAWSFAAWLLYWDIKGDREIGAVTAAVALAIGIMGGVFFDPAKVRDAVTLWREARKP